MIYSLITSLLQDKMTTTLKLLIFVGLKDKPDRELEEYLKNVLDKLAAVNCERRLSKHCVIISTSTYHVPNKVIRGRAMGFRRLEKY